MSLGTRKEVRKAGVVVGYVEFKPLGELWKALPNGVGYYLPPVMFTTLPMAEEFVRKYGKPKPIFRPQ